MKIFLVALLISGFLGNYQAFQGKASEPLHVTLVVFSGLPDPKWTINPADPNYQNIQKLFSEAGDQGLAFSPEQMPAQLGYKGFLVREEGQESAVLILGQKTKQLQQSLLKTVPAGEQIPKDLINKIGKLIEEGTVVPVDLEKTRTKRAPPDYDGAVAAWLKWNNCYRRPRNNCYNYANDKPTNTFAKPGRATGRPPITRATLTNNLVRTNAISDGLIEIPTAPAAPIPAVADATRHLVALVVAPGLDFHWYRLDSNGRWSHKPGPARRTNLDSSWPNGVTIDDPRTANRGIYTEFVCFMSTNKNTVNIR